MRGVLVVLLVLTMAGCSADTVDESLPVVHSGAQIQEGTTYRYPFYIHCGMRWLDFNDAVWKTDDPVYRGTGSRYPESLRQWFRNPDEQISPELWTYVTLAATDEITLTLPDGSSESTYRPTDEEMPGCA